MDWLPSKAPGTAIVGIASTYAPLPFSFSHLPRLKLPHILLNGNSPTVKEESATPTRSRDSLSSSLPHGQRWRKRVRRHCSRRGRGLTTLVWWLTLSGCLLSRNLGRRNLLLRSLSKLKGESTKYAELITVAERLDHGGRPLYEFEYTVDSTRGGMKRIFSAAFVASNKLYLLNIAYTDRPESPLDSDTRTVLEQILHSFDSAV